MTSLSFHAGRSLSQMPLPADIAFLIASHLDDKSIISTAGVCQIWRKAFDPFKKTAQNNLLEDHIALKMGFPPELVSAFRKKKLSLLRLPTLKIDAHNLPEEEIPSPLLRLEDPSNRPGFAIRLKGNGDQKITHTVDGTKIILPFQATHTIMFIFQSVSQKKRWVALGDQSLLHFHYYKNCQNHKNPELYRRFNYVIFPFLIDLIREKDDLCAKIDGAIEQTQGPLDEITQGLAQMMPRETIEH